jgi:phosphopantothenoylcysteine decarboxylase/phosphopantothenate--cysteine ligase
MLVDLSNKNVLVGITGSISAYKACEIVRLFVKSNANVKVVMSSEATKFISPLTFEALTRNKVLIDGGEDWSSNLNHIDIAKWADCFIIAPATANTINKLSKGIADNTLLSTALAYPSNLLIAPAANTQMLKNHYTVGSIKMLKVNDHIIIEPQSKLLACGDKGNGALAEPLEIYYQGAKALLEDEFWLDRRVVVTGGGTREKIDEVRYISNFSSGKMAKAIALQLHLRGADVCYITTKDKDELPNDIYVIDVEDANEMFEYTTDAIRVAKKGKMSKASMNNTQAPHLIQKRPYLFMVAAVADYTPAFPQEGKLKKSMLGQEWEIKLKQTTDILKNLNKDGITTVAFKAEMDTTKGLENAKKLLEEKEVDAVCYNLLKDATSFGGEENEITFITKESSTPLGRDTKLNLASKILDNAKALIDE